MAPVRVASGELEAEILPGLGARLHRVRAFGHDVLRTPTDRHAHAREPVFWGSYVMAPWCNRVEAGVRLAVGARVVTLPANFPDGTAIHGQVFSRPWEVDGPGSFVVAGGGAERRGGGWPWEYEVRQRIAVEGPTLRLSLALTNRAADPMPGGIGIHPWFLRPLRLAIRASRVYPSNTANEREPVPVGGPFDLRRLRDVPDDLDGCWAEVGDPCVELEWPATGLRATMRARVRVEGAAEPDGGDVHPATRVDASGMLHVVMASPRDLDAVGVEPQTQAPQGLRRLIDGAPGGLVLLDPGATLRLEVGLDFGTVAP